jgi:hypothetical protein
MPRFPIRVVPLAKAEVGAQESQKIRARHEAAAMEAGVKASQVLRPPQRRQVRVNPDADEIDKPDL